MIGLAIFRLAGGMENNLETDTIDVAELRAYLLSQRDKLRKFLTLFLEGAANFPIMPQTYLNSLQEDFSLERFIVCCHLLSHSTSLWKLFYTYETSINIILERTFLDLVDLHSSVLLQLS